MSQREHSLTFKSATARDTQSGPARVLLVGAGAVSQIFYLPLFRQGIEGLNLVGVVDPAVGDMQDLPAGVAAHACGFEEILCRPEVMAGVDAVLVALPHHLHARCVLMAIGQAKHVFCEKPLAMTARQVEEIAQAATRAGVIVAVCQPRRRFPAAITIKQLLDSGRIGPVESVSWHEGHPYRWPAASLSQIQGASGGSELFDIGAHVFDLLGWWLGDLEVVGYLDDSVGGTAAEFSLSLAASKTKVVVDLSRLHRLANSVRIRCGAGEIRWDLAEPERIEVDAPAVLGVGASALSVLSDAPVTGTVAAVAEELRDFGRASRGLGAPAAVPADAMIVARVFDQVAQLAKVRKQAPTPETTPAEFVVTGASGFIGCALVARLVSQGRATLALVHSPRNAVRLARLDVPMALADITRPATLEGKIPAGSTVIHCAVSQASPWATIVEGTMNVLRAAKTAGAKRVVVISSMLAMGDPPADGLVAEDARLSRSGMDYARAKAEMERQASEFASEQKLGLVILRPTCVFGPFGTDFGSNQVEAMRSGRFFLVNDGGGIANLIFVDNLVDAILAAASKPGIEGRSYILNEEEFQSTWKEYFAQLADAALGTQEKLLALSEPELAEIDRQWRRSHGFPHVFRDAVRTHPATLRWLADSALFSAWLRLKKLWSPVSAAPAPPPASSSSTPMQADSKAALVAAMLAEGRPPVDAAFTRFFASRAVYSSRLAREDLGWSPAMVRDEAMASLSAWAHKSYAYHG